MSKYGKCNGGPLESVTEVPYGRPVKRPPAFKPQAGFWTGFELFAEDGRKILKRCKAPKTWGDKELCCLLNAAGDPRWLRHLPTGVAETDFLREFLLLYSSHTDVVLEVLLAIRKRLRARRKGPTYQIAHWMLTWGIYAGRDDIWKAKAEYICDELGDSLGCKVTPRMVEKARKWLTSVRAWGQISPSF